MRGVKFKANNNNDKSKKKNRIKMEVVNKINQIRQVFHKRRTMEKVLLLWFRNA